MLAKCILSAFQTTKGAQGPLLAVLQSKVAENSRATHLELMISLTLLSLYAPARKCGVLDSDREVFAMQMMQTRSSNLYRV